MMNFNSSSVQGPLQLHTHHTHTHSSPQTGCPPLHPRTTAGIELVVASWMDEANRPIAIRPKMEDVFIVISKYKLGRDKAASLGFVFYTLYTFMFVCLTRLIKIDSLSSFFFFSEI